MNTLKTITLLACSLLFGFGTQAQDESFIYGTITTVDDQSYTGAIRWGKEEVYWSDMFNASKDKNENLDYLSREEINYLRNRGNNDWIVNNVGIRWDSWDYENSFVHQLAIPFGNIQQIEPISRSQVLVTLRNGKEIEVDGDGYNDIGSKIQVKDEELGTIELSWYRIEKISFLETPKQLDSKFGDPLYGTVKTDIGDFTGIVQWDHDERLTTDKLDGDTEDGDISIDFGNIKRIQREGYSRSIIELQSGRELELHGSNDVNSENRGIIVTVAGIGRVDIPWKSFREVEFTKAPSTDSKYKAYNKQNKLIATVTVVNGDTHSGELIFDLDEQYDFEILNGKDDDIEFEIDFKNIAEIAPKNYNYSKITLKSGRQLVLGDSQDVSDENDGLIILTNGKPVYIPWEKVEAIKF